MYFEEFPAFCERAVYFQGERPSDENEKLFRFKTGYVRLNKYDLKEFFRFIHALMIAANIGNSAQQKVRENI